MDDATKLRGPKTHNVKKKHARDLIESAPSGYGTWQLLRVVGRRPPSSHEKRNANSAKTPDFDKTQPRRPSPKYPIPAKVGSFFLGGGIGRSEFRRQRDAAKHSFAVSGPTLTRESRPPLARKRASKRASRWHDREPIVRQDRRVFAFGPRQESLIPRKYFFQELKTPARGNPRQVCCKFTPSNPWPGCRWLQKQPAARQGRRALICCAVIVYLVYDTPRFQRSVRMVVVCT